MKIETRFYTIRIDYLESHGRDFERLALPIQHELKDPELAQEARIVAAKIRDFCELLSKRPEAKACLNG